MTDRKNEKENGMPKTLVGVKIRSWIVEKISSNDSIEINLYLNVWDPIWLHLQGVNILNKSGSALSAILWGSAICKRPYRTVRTSRREVHQIDDDI